MIQDGVLVHGDQQNSLLVWRLANPVADGLLTAFLTTLLSYQAAAFILDLCMGIKRSGRARVSDIGIMLLVRSFSPVAVMYNLFPSLRARRGQKKPTSRHTRKDSEAVSFFVGFKLIFLLTITAVINIATIFFNLESTTWITFAEARFGGLALGVNPNLAAQPSIRSSKNCTRAIFMEDHGEDAMATFLNCESLQPRSTQLSQRRWDISVFAPFEGTLFLRVTSPVQELLNLRRAFVLVRGLGFEDRNDERNGLQITYQLKLDVTNQSAEMLVDYGIQMVRKICLNGSDQDEFTVATVSYPFELVRGLAFVQKVTNCNKTDPDDMDTGGAAKIIEELSKRITFIESTRLEITTSLDSPVRGTFISGQDLLLLRRRRSFVSVPILGILTSVVVFLRAFIGFVTSNDVDKGIEFILRQGLGLRCCDSMLASPHVVANYEDEGKVTRYRYGESGDDQDTDTGIETDC